MKPSLVGGGGGLAETGVANEAILEAIEKLHFTVAAHDVVRETGLPTDVVEAEMAALLRGRCLNEHDHHIHI